MNKFHFVEKNTDSMYWAIASNANEKPEQNLKYVIKKEKIYNASVFRI
jgi:hypothetical protein